MPGYNHKVLNDIIDIMNQKNNKERADWQKFHVELFKYDKEKMSGVEKAQFVANMMNMWFNEEKTNGRDNPITFNTQEIAYFIGPVLDVLKDELTGEKIADKYLAGQAKENNKIIFQQLTANLQYW